MQFELSWMMKHWNELGHFCVELKGGLFCHEPLCSLEVGWRILIKMLCSFLNSCV